MEKKLEGLYELQYRSYLRGDEEAKAKASEETARAAMEIAVPDGMEITEQRIPGYTGEKTLPSLPKLSKGKGLLVRIYRPAAEKPLPVILDIHGGGWVAGNLDTDFGRCIEIARRVPAVVVAIEYTLSDGKSRHYPAPLYDCIGAYLWMAEHAAEFGGDPGKLGINGNSAGGNLAAGLSLWLRDHVGPKCALTVLNCPVLYLDYPETHAFHQNYELRMGPDNYGLNSELAFLGGHDGGATLPPYYAFPGHCPDLRGLNPHCIIAAEYDTLRDDAVRYMERLLKVGVPVDFLLVSHVCHCFSRMPGEWTDHVHDTIALAFRREFGWC